MREPLRLAVEALDLKFGPLWDEQINLERLDMQSLGNCILGQLGVLDWSRTVRELVGWTNEDSHPCNWFAGHVGEWKTVIVSRRAERESRSCV